MDTWKGHRTDGEHANYHAYLLRLWREGSSGPWRAMLQDVATGERHGFAGLSELVAFFVGEDGGDLSFSRQNDAPCIGERGGTD